jgi:histone acetyltransferase (RNA polymerase elongator complex component)
VSKSHYIIPIFVPHEGCPHDCVFCNQNSITGSESIVNEQYVYSTIEEYLKTIKRNEDTTIEVSFFGGTFTAIDKSKQKRLLSVAKEYKDKNYIDCIRLSTRPDYIDEEILTYLKYYGVDIIELGVQSMDEDVLLKSGRGHTKENTINACKIIKSFGFTLGVQVMLGLPGDNKNKDINTVRELCELKPDISRIYPALVIKDTPMEKMYNRGEYTPYSIDEAVDIAKEIYSIFLNNNVNVIRVGLQTTDNINLGKDVIAGPFHPAFRELMESSFYCEVIENCIQENVNEFLNIKLNYKDISKLYADKKRFFYSIKNKFPYVKINVEVSDELNRGQMDVETSKKCYKLLINDYIINKDKEGKVNNL